MLLSVDVVDPDLGIWTLNKRGEVMVFQCDVLGARSELLLGRHRNARFVVFPDLALEVRFIDIEFEDSVDLLHRRHQWYHFS